METFTSTNNNSKFGWEDEHCDVYFEVEGKTFPCHRAILASKSEYFNRMLSGKFKESEQKTIKFDTLDAECFEVILQYIYYKRINISEENVYDLLMASIYFGVVEMENLCVNYLTDHLIEKQIFEICTYARSTGKKQLFDAAVKYIASKFTLLCKKEKFSKISFEILETILKHDSLERIDKATSDLVLSRWKNVSNKEGDSLRSLLKDGAKAICVRAIAGGKVREFTYQDSNQGWNLNQSYQKTALYQKNIIVNEHLFTLSRAGCRINEFVVKEANEPEKLLRKPPINADTYVLNAINNTIYIYYQYTSAPISDNSIVMNAEKSRLLFGYSYEVDQWFALPKPKYDSRGACVATMNNLLYSVAGCVQSIRSDPAHGYGQFFDPRSPRWISLPRSFNSHCRGSACPYNGKLYVLGGQEDPRYLEVFDPVAGRWDHLKSSFHYHMFFSFVAHRNKLWVFQGPSYNECYHPEQNVWKDIPSIGQQYDKVVDAFII